MHTGFIVTNLFIQSSCN